MSNPWHTATPPGSRNTLYVFIWILAAVRLAQPALAQDSCRILHSFTAGEGGDSRGLAVAGSTVNGMNLTGGSAGEGTIYQLNTDTGNFRLLHSFQGAAIDGQMPLGSLVASGNKLYGTTYSGLMSDGGTIFQINTDGTGFQVLHRLAIADGMWINGKLALEDSVLYGFGTSGGVAAGFNGYGTVFRINTDGSGFAALHTFTADSAAKYPHGAPAFAGSALYGITPAYSDSQHGTIFRINTDGSGYVVLHQFSGAPDAAGSEGTPIISGSVLYAEGAGGTNNSGTVFRMNTDGTGFQVLHSFAGAAGEGINPDGLVLSGATLYGITNSVPLGSANVFQMNTDGSGFRTLCTLPFPVSPEGDWTTGGLAVAGSTLYGVTLSPNQGVLFAWDLAPTAAAPPPVAFTSNGQTLGTGNSWDVSLVDLDGSGRMNAYFENHLWLNDGQGQFSQSATSFCPNATYTAFADLNGDGYTDAVCGNTVFFNDGSGHFGRTVQLPSTIDMVRPVLLDVNGDGAIDIIVTSASADRLLLNDGHGGITDTGHGFGG
jgi:uncharacterized repeat protein (TIGR03803 family)